MIKNLKILFFISSLFLYKNLIAQTQPSGILFQAVARDASGNAASLRTIYSIVEIREATSNGQTVYSESHQVISNEEGIFNLIIGNGVRISGVTKFDNLNWRSQIYFINLKVAIAPTLPTPGWDLNKEYVDMGTSQIWAVPYAFSAFKAVIADSATKFGGVLAGESGGTGINNLGKTITLGKNLEIQGLGNLKFNTIGLTSLTLPQNGFLATIEGSETFTNKKLLSPIFLGTPLTPTPDSLSNDSAVANIKYVKSSISKEILNLKDQFINSIDSSSDLRLKISDTLNMLSNRIQRDTISLSNRINLKVNSLNARVDSSLYVRGKVKIDSILLLNDSLIVAGNVLIDSNLTIKGKLSINGGFDFRDSLTVSRGARIDSSLLLKGKLLLNDSLLARGNVKIDSSLFVGGKLTVGSGFDFRDSLTVSRGARIDSSLLLKGKLLLNDSLLARGNVKIDSNLFVNQKTRLNDSLTVRGVTRLNDSLLARGNVKIDSNLFVNQKTRLNDSLTVMGVTRLNDSLLVRNSVKIDSNLFVGGKLTVASGFDFKDSLTVTRGARIDSSLLLKGKLILNDSLLAKGAVEVDGNILVKGLNVSDSLTKFSTTKLNAIDTASLSTRIDALSTGSNKFTADLTVNFGGGSFGKYTNGQTIPAAGKTIDEVFRDILTKVIHPSYSSPTASLTMPASGLVPSGTAASGNIEIGTNLGTLTFNPSFNKLDGGDYTSIIYRKNGGIIGSNTDNISQLTSQITYQVTYTYGAGTSVKKNNLNEDDVTNQVQAGSVNSNTVTITPASYKYWGMTTNSSANITDADILAMVGGSKEWATSKLKSSFTITGPGSSGPVKYAFYAVPAATGGTITSILAGGFESIAAFDKVTRNFTNAQGYVVSYDIYVQKNSGTDNVILIIQ